MNQLLLVGFIVGSFAMMITPQKDKSEWLTYLLIGILGSLAGGFFGGLLDEYLCGVLVQLITASIGGVSVLYIDHKYFSHKNSL